MRKRVQIALAVLLLTLLGVTAWQVFLPREPVYQGIRLSGWLEYYRSDADAPEVDEALRKFGTDAIPFLLKNLRAEDSRLRMMLTAVGLKYTPAETFHMRAEKGFGALGAEASNAVPALIGVYEQSGCPSGRHAAANALVEIGPAADQAIPALIKSTTGTNSEVRAFALYTLGRIALQPGLVAPVLIRALGDTDREVRYQAAFGLSSFAFMGGDARPAVPALIETLQDSDAGTRCGAAQALGHIHSEPGMVVPVLIKSLHDRDPNVRTHAAAALGEFGSNAKPALISLIEELSDKGQNARSAATNALKRIDPAAAAKAGVK